MARGIKFRAMVTQGGETSTLYTTAKTVGDALHNLSHNPRFANGGHLTIILRPVASQLPEAVG